jgi:hypothetical protein
MVGKIKQVGKGSIVGFEVSCGSLSVAPSSSCYVCRMNPGLRKERNASGGKVIVLD